TRRASPNRSARWMPPAVSAKTTWYSGCKPQQEGKNDEARAVHRPDRDAAVAGRASRGAGFEEGIAIADLPRRKDGQVGDAGGIGDRFLEKYAEQHDSKFDFRRPRELSIQRAGSEHRL